MMWGFPMLQYVKCLIPRAPRARGVAAGVAVLVVVAGCAGSPGESTTSDAAVPGVSPAASSAAATPSAEPTPQAKYKPASAKGPAENVPLPQLPKAATKKTKKGLIAFAEYWFSLVNYGYETGDPGPMEALTGPNCTACNAYYKSLKAAYKGDDWMAGGKLSLESQHSDFILTPKGRYQFLAEVSQGPTTYYGPGGKIYGRSKGSKKPGLQIMEATYKSGGWFVDNVETIVE
jgi:hypothetical protein